MKSIPFINCVLTFFTLLLLMAKSANAQLPARAQMVGLIDGALLSMIQPMVQSTNAATSGNFFEVVIIEDATLRKELSPKYAKFDKWLKFEPENAITYDDKRNTYVHKATNCQIYVNRFNVIGQDKDKCLVGWTRTLSSLGGFTKTVTLTFSKGAWIISEIILKAVS